MPKHIRDNKNYPQGMTMMDKAKMKVEEIKAQGMGMYIRTNPKQAMGTVIILLLLVVLGLVAAHYMGYITLPAAVAKYVPRKAAPASHLQYFFF